MRGSLNCRAVSQFGGNFFNDFLDRKELGKGLTECRIFSMHRASDSVGLEFGSPSERTAIESNHVSSTGTDTDGISGNFGFP